MNDVWEWPRAVTVEWDNEKPTGRCCYDGDTLRASVDQGRGTAWPRGTIRLAGIDTPEIRGGTAEERERARAARDHLAELLPMGTAVALASVGYDKFKDRCDAVVTRTSDGLVINDRMVTDGFAVYRDYT